MSERSEKERERLEELMASDPVLQQIAQRGMERRLAERDEQKECEKRAAEVGFIISPAVQQPPPTPPAKQFEPIAYYTAKDLRGKQIRKAPVIVAGMLPAGFSLLAGAPKRGKSWLVLAMAIAVATGRPFLGMNTLQGDVLYLDLESGESRAKSRLSLLLPGEWPESLCIAHHADFLGDNGKLLLQIEDFCNSHPNARLIVIDTVGRVKGGGRRAENAYETDTRIYGKLQAFAMERGIAIVGVHHYRKGVDDQDDWFEKISGSMGLTGVCDTVMALTGKRDATDSVLKTSSRDFEGLGDIVLRFDKGTWIVVGTDPQVYSAEKAYRESSVVRGILALLADKPEWQGTMQDMIDAILQVYHGPLEALSTAKFTVELDRKAGLLYDQDEVVLTRKRVHGKRIICLQKVDKSTI